MAARSSESLSSSSSSSEEEEIASSTAFEVLSGVDGGSVACEKVVADVTLVLVSLESVVEQGMLVPLRPEVPLEDFPFERGST
jgi:hypothetical protein